MADLRAGPQPTREYLFNVVRDTAWRVIQAGFGGLNQEQRNVLVEFTRRYPRAKNPGKRPRAQSQLAHRVYVDMTVELSEALEKRVQNDGISKPEVIRRALREYLGIEE